MPKGDAFERMAQKTLQRIQRDTLTRDTPGESWVAMGCEESMRHITKLLRSQHRAYVKVVEDEEEFDGPISETVWAELTKSRKSAARVVRLAVFATKKSILTKLNARGNLRTSMLRQDAGGDEGAAGYRR